MLGRKLDLKETQQISLEILHTVAEICEEHNLRYFLACGTLIGAIRHNGFIPWDDDLDIMMPRPDHDKLVNFLSSNKSRYPTLSVFNHDVCSEYPYMLTRISDNRYQIKMNNEKDYGLGVFIDIYPLEGLGNNLKKAQKICKKGNFLASACFQSTRERYTLDGTKKRIRKVMKYPFFLFSKLIGKDFLQNRLKNLQLQCPLPYDESAYVGCATWNQTSERAVYLKEWIEKTELHKFEQYEFRIPQGYDELLKMAYGNYMILPPKKERVGNHFYSMYEKV